MGYGPWVHEGAAWASLLAECTGALGAADCGHQDNGRAFWERTFLNQGRWSLGQTCPALGAAVDLDVGTWSMFFFLVEQVGVLELKVSHVARNYFMLAFTVAQGVQQTTRTFVSTLLGEARGAELPAYPQAPFHGEHHWALCSLSHGLFFYPEWLAAPFFDDAEGLEAAGKTLPVIFLAMLIYSGSSVMLSAIQGSGHTRTALAIEVSAILVYSVCAFSVTLWWPQPVWRIWWVEFSYFSYHGSRLCLVFASQEIGGLSRFEDRAVFWLAYPSRPLPLPSFMEPSPLRIVFFGTPDFAAASLRVLGPRAARCRGRRDRPRQARWQRATHATPSAVKTEALKHGFPLAQPEKLRA